MKLSLKMAVTVLALAAFTCHAADEKQKPSGEKSGSIDRAGTKAAKAMEKAGDRGVKAAVGGAEKAGKWAGRQGERAGKAVGHAADKTEGWVKKKTE